MRCCCPLLHSNKNETLSRSLEENVALLDWRSEERSDARRTRKEQMKDECVRLGCGAVDRSCLTLNRASAARAVVGGHAVALSLRRVAVAATPRC